MGIEAKLRGLLWASHRCDGKYCDDGELQCGRFLPVIDFKRDSPEEIERKIPLHYSQLSPKTPDNPDGREQEPDVVIGGCKFKSNETGTLYRRTQEPKPTGGRLDVEIAKTLALQDGKKWDDLKPYPTNSGDFGNCTQSHYLFRADAVIAKTASIKEAHIKQLKMCAGDLKQQLRELEREKQQAYQECHQKLKRIKEWGESFCVDVSHYGHDKRANTRKRECHKCWQAIWKEAGIE